MKSRSLEKLLKNNIGESICMTWNSIRFSAAETFFASSWEDFFKARLEIPLVWEDGKEKQV